MRTGGDKFAMSAEYRTDDFVRPGNQFLGTTPQGLKDISLTMGGPIGSGLRYFLAGEYTYWRNDQSLFLEPFHFDGLTDDGLYGGTATRGRLLVAPDPAEAGIIEFKRNYVYKNWTGQSALNANISADLKTLADVPLTLKLAGVFAHSMFPGGGSLPGSGGEWPEALNAYFRSEEREMMNETRTAWASAIASLRLSSESVFDVTVSYQQHSTESYDPEFGRSGFDDYLQYPDSVANAARSLRTNEWRSRYTGPSIQSTIYGFALQHPSSPNNVYSQREQTAFSFEGRLSATVSSAWKLAVGGGVNSWTLRSYRFGN
ncbi:MAG: hypothetical protein IH628_15675, partial [Proteobacteria bacterium]|nr:hypothetical protein [Pseudomonadota bacterium]